MFSSPIPSVAYVLLSLAFVCLVAALVYGLRPMYFAVRAMRKKIDVEPNPENCPKASIIIFSETDNDRLEETLDAMVSEDYPDFEIIVVCEATSDRAKMLNEKFSHKYQNVYVTFIPPGSHNLSRRKLAITSGVKAALGDIIVTTCADIILPPDHHWLKSIMAPFCGPDGFRLDLVLGLSVIKFSESDGPERWYRQYDSVIEDAQWIGYAEMGLPYRGDGFNLAFRRTAFFENKGFARTINLHNGEDDIFVTEIARQGNCGVVVNPESILITDWQQLNNLEWKCRKEGYQFTAKWLPKAPFINYRALQALRWLIPGCAIAAAIIALPNIIASIFALCFLCSFWGIEIYLYRVIAQRLNIIRLWWAIVPFGLWQPIADIIFRVVHYKSSKQNYTWQR